MRMFKVGLTSFMATLLVAFLAGCGQQTVTVPSVISASPAQGSTSVPVNTTLSATFSMAMNSSTLNPSTFTVTGPGGASVAGSVSYSGTTVTFTPSAALAYNSLYTATIGTGAKNLGGVSLLGAYVWSFTTITPAPLVTATTPANAAVSVPVTQALSATFSEAMTAGTISASTFTLSGPGATSVAGSVSYTGTVATFVPAANLAFGTEYTATITTGAQDLAGTPLASAYVWTFTTITPPPSVLATVPVNTATGVPVSQVVAATFNESMSCATLNSPATAFTVTGPGATPVSGTVSCSGNIATFTPTADLAVNTLYTAAIGTAAKDLAGTPLSSNYVWTFLTLPASTAPTVISTMPINQAIGVPVNQALTATFSAAMNSSTIDTATFTLTGPGAVAVTGVVTYVAAGSVATFTPSATLAPSTVYTATITTGAAGLDDSPLAADYVWTFTTSADPNLTAPSVLATIPANLATNTPINQVVTATFKSAMNPSTISSSTFTLTGPGLTNVSGLVAYAAVGNTLTFTPSTDLQSNTLYTATITTGAQNLAGNGMAVNYVWTFTTGAASAVIPPEIVSTTPDNAASNVPLNASVSATFTEAMNPLTITSATFTVTGPGGSAVVGTLSYDAINFIVTFTPTEPFAPDTIYTATVTQGATDLNHNPLGNTGAQNPWSFTTGTIVIPPPVVLGSTILQFGGFGGNAGMTNEGINTVVNGDIATTAASSLITGFHDTTVEVGTVYECTYTETTLNKGLVNGTIKTAPGTSQPTAACPNEATAVTFAIATQAALEARTAYNTLAAIPNGLDVSLCPGCGGGSAGELGNRTLAPGVYKSAPGSYAISAGPLTLDAKGDPSASWVFQMASSLTVGTPTASESVILVNGAKAANVYWQVGGLPGAVINYAGGGTMVGTIISQPGITISSPGQSTSSTVTTINGRVLALNASVTMVNTVINVP